MARRHSRRGSPLALAAAAALALAGIAHAQPASPAAPAGEEAADAPFTNYHEGGYVFPIDAFDYASDELSDVCTEEEWGMYYEATGDGGPAAVPPDVPECEKLRQLAAPPAGAPTAAPPTAPVATDNGTAAADANAAGGCAMAAVAAAAAAAAAAVCAAPLL